MYINRILIFSIVFLIGQNIYSQKKPGYFDYSKVEESFPVSERIEEFKQALQKHFNDSIKILQHNLENAYSGHHQLRLDSAKRANMEATLNMLNEDINRFQNSVMERYNKELEKIRLEMKSKVILVVKGFCLKNKIDVMVEKGAMIYCADCKDYTDEIIEYINSGNSCQ